MWSNSIWHRFFNINSVNQFLMCTVCYFSSCIMNSRFVRVNRSLLSFRLCFFILSSTVFFQTLLCQTMFFQYFLFLSCFRYRLCFPLPFFNCLCSFVYPCFPQDFFPFSSRFKTLYHIVIAPCLSFISVLAVSSSCLPPFLKDFVLVSAVSNWSPLSFHQFHLLLTKQNRI